MAFMERGQQKASLKKYTTARLRFAKVLANYNTSETVSFGQTKY